MAEDGLRPYQLVNAGTSALSTSVLVLDDSTFAAAKYITAFNLIASRVLAGNIVVVDQVNGNDSFALHGSLGATYKTLPAAQTAAVAGDCIVVYPGDYLVTAPLGVDGVDWWLYPGVTIRTDESFVGDPQVFSDGGSVLSFSVGGFGNIYAAGASVVSNYAGAIVTLNAASDIRVEANEIASTLSVGGATTAAVNVGAGNVRIKANKIYSTTPGGYGVWWGSDGKAITDGGDLHITTPSIESVGGIIKASIANSATNSAYINADHLETTSLTDAGITNVSESNEGKLWVKNAGQILANAEAVISTGGKTYITAQKIAGNTGSGNTSGVVTLSAGGVPKLWLNTEKITYTYGYAINCTDAAAVGQCLNLQAEDLGFGSGTYHRTAGTLNVNFNAI